MKAPLIVKWRYWNSRSVGEGRSGNYLRYIGTRDGVEKLTEKTYLDYMGTRPRVEKNGGAHGLFSDDDVPLRMDAERERLNRHDGTVHTLILSLSREDAEATGFNCAARWRSFLRTQKLTLAKQFGIPPESLRWYGAFHNEGSHPHVHVLLYSEDPEHPGYLKRQGLERIKRDFATEIFRHELDSIYQRQTAQRDELTQIARDEIRELVMEMRSGSGVDPELARRMRELSEKLKTVKGKNGKKRKETAKKGVRLSSAGHKKTGQRNRRSARGGRTDEAAVRSVVREPDCDSEKLHEEHPAAEAAVAGGNLQADPQRGDPRGDEDRNRNPDGESRASLSQAGRAKITVTVHGGGKSARARGGDLRGQNRCAAETAPRAFRRQQGAAGTVGEGSWNQSDDVKSRSCQMGTALWFISFSSTPEWRSETLLHARPESGSLPVSQ